MRVSAVVAAHDEAATIGSVVRGIREHTAGLCQLLVVDDGSTDATAAEARAAGAEVLPLRPNRGKGAALLAALPRVEGDYVLFIDGDGQDDPADIPRLLVAAEAGADFVNGSRWLGELHPGAISLPNRLGNRLMTELLNLRAGARITDSQAGFRLIRVALLRGARLRSVEYEVETEMLLHALRSGADVREVPVARHPRAGGHTDFRRIRNGLRILATIAAGRPILP